MTVSTTVESLKEDEANPTRVPACNGRRADCGPRESVVGLTGKTAKAKINLL